MRLRSSFAIVLLVALAGFAASASAQPAGKGRVVGKVLASDTGDPVGFAEVALLPADTTGGRRIVGANSTAEGTFLLDVLPGVYTLQVRAISYAHKLVTGIIVQAGVIKDVSVSISTEALQQEEVVVEAKAIQSSEGAMLAARRRAVSVGDAVSAEQVKKSADRDASEILRRVTGVSVSDSKYVFVRGLGERYSSTEVDGVRIASPEQNKRVVPLDLLPANLLDNIVVQKTYTADRPGEFGGGDVQVHTKDFPDGRTFQLATGMGFQQDATFKDRDTYTAPSGDVFGFSAPERGLPQEVTDIAGTSKLTLGVPPRGFKKSTLADVAKSFPNTWSSSTGNTPLNGLYALTYGDLFKVAGRDLGVIASWSYSNRFEHQNSAQRFYPSTADTLYDYAVTSSSELTQLGGLTGISYRLSPEHSIHVRGFYTKSAEDEVRLYEGPDHNRIESTSNTYLVHRDTRLMYVERSILSGALEGQHLFPQWRKLAVDWKLTGSSAKRDQPDRRETTYDRNYYDDGTGNLVGYWVAGSAGIREYGALDETGWGQTLNVNYPYLLRGRGNGKIALGFDHQSKDRTSNYRRFAFYRRQDADPTAPPESLFAPGQFDSTNNGAYVDETTLNPQDNYVASQAVTAGYISVDVPFHAKLRGTLGVRVENGLQDITSYDLFNPAIFIEGKFDNTDWLPSLNLTWSATSTLNVRGAASRTLSRPDLNELSPRASLEYVGGFQQAGNPELHRALIDNYDLRAETYPSVGEVLALGVFYKDLHDPIEQVIQGGTPPLLIPRNSDHGHNLGVELETRIGLGRVWDGLKRLSLNANATFISSQVYLQPQISVTGSQQHPLQGQASYLANGALTYRLENGKCDATVLLTTTGRRLDTLGLLPLPDVYQVPVQSLDMAFNLLPLRYWRVKLTARNLLDPMIRRVQGEKEVSSYRNGRSIGLGVSYGS